MSEQLRIARLLAASPAEVFAAWTTKETMEQWFGPGPMKVSVTELDARPGGRFRVEMTDPEGATHTAHGVYEDVERDSRLAFSWNWEGADMPPTRVTVELQPSGDKTELVLVHDGFPNAEARDQHLHGWSGSTAKLEEMFTQAAASQAAG